MVNDMLVANGTTRARLKRRKKQRCRRACCDKERERAARGLSVYDSCAVTGTAAAHAIRSLSAPLSSSPRARTAALSRANIPHLRLCFFLCETGAATIELSCRERNHSLINDMVTQEEQDNCRNIFRLDLYKKLNIRTPPMRSQNHYHERPFVQK
jgi:hypothetical protein